MTQPTSLSSIYLTYKTRMVTEAKLRATGKAYNLLITWYAFWLIVLSLADTMSIYKIPYSDFFFTTCSIATFGLSLLVYGERYFEKADEFRSCYLSLQKIFRSSSSVDSKMKQYHEVLEFYPNQSDADYDEMVFDAHFRNQKLENAAGEIKLTWQSWIKVFIRKAGRYLYWFLLFGLPILPLAIGMPDIANQDVSESASAMAVIDAR